MTALLAVMVVGVVTIAIAYPLFRPGPQAPPDPIGPAARLAALEERKLQLYASIRELGFDYRTDKLEKEDYEAEVDRVKAEAIEVVRRIEELRSDPPRATETIEAEIAALRDRFASGAAGPPAREAGEGAIFCTQCGSAAGSEDRFCAACGTPLRAS